MDANVREAQRLAYGDDTPTPWKTYAILLERTFGVTPKPESGSSPLESILNTIKDKHEAINQDRSSYEERYQEVADTIRERLEDIDLNLDVEGDPKSQEIPLSPAMMAAYRNLGYNFEYLYFDYDFDVVSNDDSLKLFSPKDMDDGWEKEQDFIRAARLTFNYLLEGEDYALRVFNESK